MPTYMQVIMLNGQPFSRLPKNPIKFNFKAKIVLGIIFLSFLSGYQPQFTIPPFKLVQAQAQNVVEQQVNAAALPFSVQLPHPGYMSTPYSTYHPGVDIATGLGMPIKAVAEGTVIETGFDFWGLGLKVEIEHPGGYKSMYAHMGKIYVKKGQNVTNESTLGEVGMTGNTSGPHTHLEIKKDNQYINPQSLLPQIRQQPAPEDFKASNQNKATGGRN